MKHMMTTVMMVALIGTTAVAAHAQAPAAPSAPPHHEAPAVTMPPGPGPRPGMGGGPMSMEMCQQMMAGMTHGMMGGMAGMHADRPMDPKAMAPMMEMHGEMMKAMGEIMMKHAKKMAGSPSSRP